MTPLNSTAAASTKETLYTVLAQVKSNRVVYFTDDPEYVPPVVDDWYFASSYRGALPANMTLRNCWSWRFNGSSFVEAKGERPLTKAQVLLEHNRRALVRILTDKIDALRRPYVVQAALGEDMRRLKLEEAQAYLCDPTSREQYRVLEAVAVARNISLLSAAELVIKQADQTREVLIATERIRERFSLLIAQASSDEELLRLRGELLKDVYPELSSRLGFWSSHTEPRDPAAHLAEHHRVHEITRLKVQLRQRINDMRRSVDAGYVWHTEVLKFKARIAKWVVAPTGETPLGIDVVESYASSRGLTLEVAAKQILADFVNAGNTLSSTERLKDKLLARIESIRTLADIQKIEGELADKIPVLTPAPMTNGNAPGGVRTAR
ncbi:hypothetical protein ADM96_37310 [Burkholderia sp. ST111]|nr:hypothetical protein ADM96_37310 [Burkholderia sp. ST111]